MSGNVGINTGNASGESGRNLEVLEAKPKIKPYEISGYRAPISVDARPMGKGKTREASKHLISQEDRSNPLFYFPRKCQEENLEKYPIMTVNYYVAPNTTVKNSVFSKIKGEKNIIKGKDSRFFLDLKNSNKEKPIDKVYRKVHAGGPPVCSAVFGKNTLMYVLYAERLFNQIGVDRVSRLYLDDVIPGLNIVAIPITKIVDGKEVTGRYEGVDEWYLKAAPSFLLDIEERGISADALREEQVYWIKELASASVRFLLRWPEPIYLTKMGFGPYVWPKERLKRMLLHGEDLYIASEEEYYAFVQLMEWLVGAPNFFISTPNKPKASRSLSSVLEENSEFLLREAAKIELMVLALQGTEWARKVMQELSQGKTVKLSDIQTNVVLAHVFSSAGIQVNILNGTSLIEGGGFVHHDRKGILITAVEDPESGRFESWHVKQIISYNDRSLEQDPEGGREDVRITLDGQTSFPTIEEGAREFMARTGLNLYEIRMSLEDSTVAPIMSIKNIYIPKPRGRFTNLVYRDLDRKLKGKESPRSFSWFSKRVRGAGSQTLVRNLHIIARTIRLQDDYEIVRPISHMEDMLEQVAGTGEGTGIYLGVYATVMMAELLRRYAKDPESTRIVIDPKILSLISKVPAYWIGNSEIEKDYQLISKYLPGTIAQANRGRSDRIVYGKRAHVIWITAVDPLYERSEFRWFVGLSEINQTLGRFVHRGEASAKEIDLVYLGGGKSDFSFKAIASLIDHLLYAEVDEEKVPVYATDGINRKKILVRLCGHTLSDLYEAEYQRRRKEWREKAEPEQLISDEEWAYVEKRMKEVEEAGGRPVDIILAAFEAMSEIDAKQPLISEEWYKPGFDHEVADRARRVELKRALEPRSWEEVERERKMIKEMEARRERRYIESIKIYLEEEYNLSTSLNDKNKLKELIYHLEEYGKVPNELRRYVWDSDGREENPYL